MLLLQCMQATVLHSRQASILKLLYATRSQREYAEEGVMLLLLLFDPSAVSAGAGHGECHTEASADASLPLAQGPCPITTCSLDRLCQEQEIGRRRLPFVFGPQVEESASAIPVVQVRWFQFFEALSQPLNLASNLMF